MGCLRKALDNGTPLFVQRAISIMTAGVETAVQIVCASLFDARSFESSDTCRYVYAYDALVSLGVKCRVYDPDNCADSSSDFSLILLLMKRMI